MYRGVVLLHSPHDNLHSFPAFGYNSIQRPVIVVSTSIYCLHPTVVVCFPDPPSLPCDRFLRCQIRENRSQSSIQLVLELVFTLNKQPFDTAPATTRREINNMDERFVVIYVA